MSVTAVIFAALAIVFAVFVWMNQQPATVQFLAWRYDTSVGIAVIVPLVAGLLVGFLASWGRVQMMQAQLRNAEARTRSAEGKLREIARQSELIVTEEQ